MIKALFLKIINMSITASVVIMAVMLIRWLFRKQPKIYSYVLWGIVLFRLLCPYSFSLDTSLFNFIPPAQTQGGQIEYITESTISSPQSEYNAENDVPIYVAPQLEQQIEAVKPVENTIVVSNDTIIDWINILAIIWVFGIIYIILNNIISLHEIKQSLNESTHFYGNVYISKIIPTAFIIGILNPKIYLPDNLDNEQLKYILLHEETHIRRNDYLFKFSGFVAVAVHWFNPLVWLAFKLAESDMEMSCDEAVIKELNSYEKAEYSQTLLNISSVLSKQSAMHLAFSEGDTKDRIINIFNYKKPRVKYIFILLLCILACALLLITNPVSPTAYHKTGVKVKDISHIVLLSEDKYLDMPESINYTVTEKLKNIRLSPAGEENKTISGTHSIFISSAKGKYRLNFNDDFSQMWILADDYDDNGKVYTIDKPENISGFVTDNIEHNWDKTEKRISEAAFWLKTDATAEDIGYRAAHFYIKNIIKLSEYSINNVECINADVYGVLDYPLDLYADYDYVAEVEYESYADNQTVCTTVIIYIKQINDNNYEIIGTDNDAVKNSPENTNIEVFERVAEMPYVSITEKDLTMTLGTSSVASTGKNGLCLEKVKYYYDENNNLIKEEIVETTILQESEPAVTKIGTVWNGVVITGGSGKLSWPTAAGYVSRGFVNQYPAHNGLDIAAPVGTAILAADSGVVTKALNTEVGYGIYCVIDHGGYQTLYGQCSDLDVIVGQHVEKGQIIGYVGSTGNSTGPHLHFEVKKGDTRYNPYDWL